MPLLTCYVLLNAVCFKMNICHALKKGGCSWRHMFCPLWHLLLHVEMYFVGSEIDFLQWAQAPLCLLVRLLRTCAFQCWLNSLSATLKPTPTPRRFTGTPLLEKGQKLSLSDDSREGPVAVNTQITAGVCAGGGGADRRQNMKTT